METKDRCNIDSPYHIFKLLINGIQYRSEKVYTDSEFNEIMNLVGWYMPFNLSAYHFNSDEYPPMCINPVVKSMPVIDLSIELLFSTNPTVKMKLKEVERRKTQIILRKWESYVLAEDGYEDSPYGRLVYVDGKRFKIIASLTPKPITLKKAKEYINKNHRHNMAALGHKFSICLVVPDEKEPIGVVLASVPKARETAKDNYILEINRCCVNQRYDSACSRLYALAIQAGKSMGYQKFITYTLPTESGSSLKAVGFKLDGITSASPRGWATPSRPRKTPERYPVGEKLRWILDA